MNNRTELRKLIVYGREGCHLCEDMIASLGDLQKEFRFEFVVINIDKDENLTRLYNKRVPVLFAVKEKKELCHYFLDLEAFNAYLANSNFLLI
ncbi:Glutaredoxin-like domain [Nitrosomonas eutropha]|uniref:glutaredoxin family protein n=1 Tax=Nitrosomonas TaxID=914 RepID=UPI0008873D6B|nr:MULTISPECIES: glutaredoxin family protein [Nitrosomonas]MXS79356.1 glutaredoxin family protein [Nitrosomonas sp. GH22]SCX24926.1 Glutaredoxin-like domain [Nitrosomonas eutropha]SDW97487.1 Glutaredoxin-like domain [Nitrosomonas eutropha]